MEHRKAIVILSTVMAPALAVVSFFGALDAATYERDAAFMAAQGAGLDLSITLPGLVLTAVLLMKKRRLGYILAPALLVFIIILSVALAGMVTMTKVQGITEDMSIAIIFIVLAVISIVFLYLFLESITVTKKGRA